MNQLQSLWSSVFFLAAISMQSKIVQGQDRFKIYLDYYQELSKDYTTKCIKLCVTSSPTGKPRCNLNTTTGYATARFRPGRTLSYLRPNTLWYSFSKWEDFTEVSVTVWRLPPGKTCAHSNPTNTTFHGTGHNWIAQGLGIKQLIIDDHSTKWRLSLETHIKCSTTSLCIPPCVPRDDSKGHYTCDGYEKKCLPNWYARNCLKRCVPQNGPLGHYTCSNIGEKQCLTDWYGDDCNCDKKAKTYSCTERGKKTCFNDWFGENCSKFCNQSAQNYNCSENGDKICLPNWFDKNCSTFCSVTAETYNCSRSGGKTCLENWFGTNCTIFCNTSAQNYNCSENGEQICLDNWYDKHCSTFCNSSSENYYCNDKGEIVCLPNWFNKNCSKFCDRNASNYNCTSSGDRICLLNWFGETCDRFCNTSAKNYKCRNNGERECLPNWYGEKCSDFCNNNATVYRCNEHGERVCLRNWYSKNCSKFCDNSTRRYKCNLNGNRICLPHWYGNKCDIHCNGLGALRDLYLCQVKEGPKASCPTNWETRTCSSSCIRSEGEYLESLLMRCNSKPVTTRLCSKNTTDIKGCNLKTPEQGKELDSAKNVTNTVVIGWMVGVMSLIMIVIIIVAIYISLKKTSRVSSQPPHTSANRELVEKTMLNKQARNYLLEDEQLGNDNMASKEESVV